MATVLRSAITVSVALLAATSVAPAAERGASGAVEQSIGPPVRQHRSAPALHLSDSQRARIRQAVGPEDTDVSFALKPTKSAASFQPSVGAKIPNAVKGHTLPPPLIYEMPALKQYKYVKFKDQVLIVDPMSRKIVDLFPLVQG